jgi:hypothetical protein
MERLTQEIHKPRLYERFLARSRARSLMLFAQVLFEVEDTIGIYCVAMFPTNLRSAMDSEAAFVRAINFASATVWQ